MEENLSFWINNCGNLMCGGCGFKCNDSLCLGKAYYCPECGKDMRKLGVDENGLPIIADMDSIVERLAVGNLKIS